MIKTTKAQRKAILLKFLHSPDKATSYKEFRKRVQATFYMDNAVVLPWCGMFLAIETDGYTHS